MPRTTRAWPIRHIAFRFARNTAIRAGVPRVINNQRISIVPCSAWHLVTPTPTRPFTPQTRYNNGLHRSLIYVFAHGYLFPFGSVNPRVMVPTQKPDSLRPAPTAFGCDAGTLILGADHTTQSANRGQDWRRPTPRLARPSCTHPILARHPFIPVRRPWSTQPTQNQPQVANLHTTATVADRNTNTMTADHFRWLPITLLP